MATQQQSSAPSYPGMERWRGKVALVTGASSGIGYETAKQLTQLGMNVVGCARNIAKIEVWTVDCRSTINSALPWWNISYTQIIIKINVVTFFCLQSLASELGSAAGKLVAIKCDMAKEEEVIAMFGKIKEQFGGVDVCVNNAGLAQDAPLLTGATSDWRQMTEVKPAHALLRIVWFCYLSLFY